MNHTFAHWFAKIQSMISYMTYYSISPSIFETNPFLTDNKETTLIEYAAFFGSIQIFQYLLMNDAKLIQSLRLFAIHSKNAELIHLLESNEVSPPKSFERCLIESIKYRHNDFADYIENNFIDQTEKDSKQNISDFDISLDGKTRSQLNMKIIKHSQLFNFQFRQRNRCYS